MKRIEDNPIATKSKKFAVRCIRLYKFLCEQKHEFTLSRQLLRSGTSIGANIWESMKAESPADFVHKLRISLKEANESLYWILLLEETEYISPQEADSLHNDCEELIKMLTSIIKSKLKSAGYAIAMDEEVEYSPSANDFEPTDYISEQHFNS